MGLIEIGLGFGSVTTSEFESKSARRRCNVVCIDHCVHDGASSSPGRAQQYATERILLSIQSPSPLLPSTRYLLLPKLIAPCPLLSHPHSCYSDSRHYQNKDQNNPAVHSKKMSPSQQHPPLVATRRTERSSRLMARGRVDGAGGDSGGEGGVDAGGDSMYVFMRQWCFAPPPAVGVGREARERERRYRW